MRDYMQRVMTETFGPPDRTREDCVWWLLKHDHHPEVHICLDSPAHPEMAHVLIFNPAGGDGERVIDVTARAAAEADAIVERIAELTRTK